MATTTVANLEVNDAELFNDALGGDAPQQAPEPDAAPQPEPAAVEDAAPARDEKGRFVARDAEPQEAEPQAAPTAEPEDDKAAPVPSWRLREVREDRDRQAARATELERLTGGLQEKLQYLEEALNKLQNPPKPKAEPVDFFTDPEAAFNQRLGERFDPIQAKLREIEQKTTLKVSEALSVLIHGKDIVDAAKVSLAQAQAARDPSIQALSVAAQQSDDPVGEVVRWHQDRQTRAVLSKHNNDIDAYALSRLEDPKFLVKVEERLRGAAAKNDTARGTPTVQVPPNINRMAGSGSHTPGDRADGTDSDAALFKIATSRGR